MLIGVPDDGLAIEWDELNHLDASRPPVFGRSTEEDLMWKIPSAPRALGAHEPVSFLLSCKEVFCSEGGLLWIGCAIFTISLLLVQCFIIDNDVLKSVTAFSLSTIVYFAISFCVLGVADYNEAQKACNNSHDMYSGEVQFVGSNREPPHLSQGGRRHHDHQKYVRLFIGGVTYGTFSIVASRFAASHELKSLLLFVGSFNLFFAFTGLVAATVFETVAGRIRETS
jgi:hypothetical protein